MRLHALHHRYGRAEMRDYRLDNWVVLRFSDLDLYFLPQSVQKNGGYAGIQVRVDLTRPRAKPRAIRSSVAGNDMPRGRNAAWKEISTADVPEAVKAAAAEKEKR